MPPLKSPRTHYLGMITGLAVYVVDGAKIRNDIDIDFTCGGNESVYPNYVPKGEIWIDDVLGPLDRTATLLHEIVERNLMVSKGWSYDRAHTQASARERPFRREMQQNPPRACDLKRVTEWLLVNDGGTPGPMGSFDREYPKVAGVGKRREALKIKREVNQLIDHVAAKRPTKTR